MITDLLTNEQQKHLIKRHLNKDDVLFHEDENCDCIGIVEEGTVLIISYLEDGNEIIYNILNENELFGNNLIFSSDTRYKGDIIATKDSEIILIKKDDLFNILSTNREFLKEYLNIQADFTKKLNNTIKLLSIRNARERFIFYMHSKNGRVTYESISSLSKQLYLERETLSRLLSRMEKEGIISHTRKTITMYNQI